MNVIIGMIVDSVVENSRQLQREELDIKIRKKKQMLDHVREVVEAMDSNGDGQVSITELDKCLAMPKSPLLHLLDDKDLSLHLPVGFSSDELLLMLDEAGDENLDVEAFVQSFYRLLDSGPFQQICLVQTGINGMKRSVRRVQLEQRRMFQRLDARIDRLLRRLEPLAGLPDEQDRQPAAGLVSVSGGSEQLTGRASTNVWPSGAAAYEGPPKLEAFWHGNLEAEVQGMQAMFSEVLRRLRSFVVAVEVAQGAAHSEQIRRRCAGAPDSHPSAPGFAAMDAGDEHPLEPQLREWTSDEDVHL